jgi:hypothetical protein
MGSGCKKFCVTHQLHGPYLQDKIESFWLSPTFRGGKAGNTKGGSIIVPLTSCLTGLDYSLLQIKTKIVSCHTAESRPVKQEVNGTVILPPLVFPEKCNLSCNRGIKIYFAMFHKF